MTLVLGDFGRLNPAPIHGWNVNTLAFLPVTVDATGALITTGGGGGGGTVDQGTGGSSAWKVDGSAVTQPVSLASAPTTAVTNAGLTNLDVALSTRLKPADTLTKVTTVDTITNAVGAKEAPDATSAFSPTNATVSAYAASLVVKGSAGTLYAVTGYNSKSATQFIQVHNATALPADTAVPAMVFAVAPQDNFSLSADKFGRFFSTGIVVCNSSTGPTKTIGAADCWFDVQYQ